MYVFLIVQWREDTDWYKVSELNTFISNLWYHLRENSDCNSTDILHNTVYIYSLVMLQMIVGNLLRFINIYSFSAFFTFYFYFTVMKISFLIGFSQFYATDFRKILIFYSIHFANHKRNLSSPNWRRYVESFSIKSISYIFTLFNQ